MSSATKIRRRINVMLSVETVRRLNRVSRRGERSQLIDEAVRQYLRELSRQQIRRAIQEGAHTRAERDRGLAREWFAIEHEL